MAGRSEPLTDLEGATLGHTGQEGYPCPGCLPARAGRGAGPTWGFQRGLAPLAHDFAKAKSSGLDLAVLRGRRQSQRDCALRAKANP